MTACSSRSKISKFCRAMGRSTLKSIWIGSGGRNGNRASRGSKSGSRIWPMNSCELPPPEPCGRSIHYVPQSTSTTNSAPASRITRPTIRPQRLMMSWAILPVVDPWIAWYAVMSDLVKPRWRCVAHSSPRWRANRLRSWHRRRCWHASTLRHSPIALQGYRSTSVTYPGW